jgi:hypothetical protein
MSFSSKSLFRDRNAKNGQEKDFLLKEEFILFCLNESEILYLLLKQKANLEV